MDKKAWPWILSTEYEMGNNSSYKEPTKEINTQERLDSLTPYKYLSEEVEPIKHENGVTSPVENISYSKDKKNKASIEIINDEDLIANFSCDIAKDFQDKVAGLQRYDSLQESAGLLFEYTRPEDVIYHMGTVKFAIDIIFVDEDNKIKKICKNIQPNTLGTFSCSGVKNVLEICGGLSQRLGISTGCIVDIKKGEESHIPGVNKLNKVSKHIGNDKDIIVKYSSILPDNIYKWNNFIILNISNKLHKTAKKSNYISKIVLNNKPEYIKNIYAFDFDGLIEKSPMIRVYKTIESNDFNTPYVNLDGTATSILKSAFGKEIYRDFHIKDLKNIQDNESIFPSFNRSFVNFLNSDEVKEDCFKMFNEVRRANYEKDCKVVVATRFKNTDLFKKLIASRFKMQTGDDFNFELINLPNDSDEYNIVKIIRAKYGNKNIKIFSDESLLKRAYSSTTSPVSNKVTQTAEEIRDNLKKSIHNFNKFKEFLTQNLEEYKKIQDPGVIKNTGGQYTESVERNSKRLYDMITNLQKTLELLSSRDIKDVSTTEPKIQSILGSLKSNNDIVNDIFKLSTAEPEFLQKLTDLMGKYENSSQDLDTSIKNTIQYINKEILGLDTLIN
jgi:uncharacterized membrane protein (UPF0127 family)